MGIRVTYNPEASAVAGPALASGIEQSKRFYLQANQNQQRINLESQRINLQARSMDDRAKQADLNRKANLLTQENAHKNRIDFFKTTNDARIAETEARNQEARDFFKFQDEINDENKLDQEFNHMQRRDEIRIENQEAEAEHYDLTQKRQLAKIKQSMADIDNKPWPQYIKDQAKQQLEFNRMGIKPKQKKMLPSIDDQIMTEVKKNEDGSYWQRDANGGLSFHKAPLAKDETRKQAIYAKALSDVRKDVYSKENRAFVEEKYQADDRDQAMVKRWADRELKQQFEERWNVERNILDNYDKMGKAEVDSPGMASKIMNMGNKAEPAPKFENKKAVQKANVIQEIEKASDEKTKDSKHKKKISNYMQGAASYIKSYK